MHRAGHRLLFVASLAFVLSACESLQDMNPFAEKQTPLPGDRQPLFPEGVPGVDFSAPPQQPMNSNIPIPAQLGSTEDRPPGPEKQPAEETRQARAPTPAKSQPARAAKSQPARAAKSDPDDPWAGAR